MSVQSATDALAVQRLMMLERYTLHARRQQALLRERLAGGASAGSGRLGSCGSDMLEGLAEYSAELAFEFKVRQVEALIEFARDSSDLMVALLTLEDLYGLRLKVKGWVESYGMDADLQRLNGRVKTQAGILGILSDMGGTDWAVVCNCAASISFRFSQCGKPTRLSE